MRASTYRSSSSNATPTLSRWASCTRSSPPTRAVNDTLFGAENVASHPARCSIALTFSPCLFVYSLAAWWRISCSPVIGCCPSESRWKFSSRTSPRSPHCSASLPCHSPRIWLAGKGLVKAFEKWAPRIAGCSRAEMNRVYCEQTGREMSDYILVQQADKAVRYNQLPPEAEVVRRTVLSTDSFR